MEECVYRVQACVCACVRGGVCARVPVRVVMHLLAHLLLFLNKRTLVHVGLQPRLAAPAQKLSCVGLQIL